MSKRNIRKVLDRAGAVEINEGRNAYFNYRRVCCGLAEYYGYPLEQTTAVFAALSPNNDYVGNLRSTASVLLAHRLGVPLEAVRISTYNHCRDRAWSYLNGTSFLETVKGKKIRSFYHNLLNPMDSHYVTIDGHAFNIWTGRRVSLKTMARAKLNYDRVADDYRAVAASAGLLPSQLQAITWLTWKWIHNIIPSRYQLEFFQDRSGDLWKTIYEPEDIIPFGFKEPYDKRKQHHKT